MSILDVSLLLANLAMLALIYLPRQSWLIAMPALAAVLAIAQLVLEGYRWQLLPLYLLTLALFLLKLSTRRRPVTRSGALAWAGWILAAATIGLGAAFPIIQLPKPTGPFAVETIVRHLIDVNRTETLAADIHAPRELMIQIWYPADRPQEEQNRLIQRTIQFFRVHFSRHQTRGFVNAPISAAQASYPVLIYSPSWHGQRAQNTFQCEELASHGFIVVGIDHPYSSAITIFPDGRVARAALIDIWDFSSDEAFKRALEYDERQLRVRVQDVEFVVRELEHSVRHGSQDFLREHLDLSRLGIFGYSFGGAVAAQVCWLDKRFGAGINMDGTLFGEVAEAGIQQPFLFMDDDTQPPTMEQVAANPEKRRFAELVERDVRRVQHSLERYGGYRLRISGTRHVNFTEPPSNPPMRYYLVDAGRINPGRALRIINAYTLAFFEKYLNKSGQPLLDSPSSPYPEVQLTYQPPPTGPLN